MGKTLPRRDKDLSRVPNMQDSGLFAIIAALLALATLLCCIETAVSWPERCLFMLPY